MVLPAARNAAENPAANSSSLALSCRRTATSSSRIAFPTAPLASGSFAARVRASSALHDTTRHIPRVTCHAPHATRHTPHATRHRSETAATANRRPADDALDAARLCKHTRTYRTKSPHCAYACPSLCSAFTLPGFSPIAWRKARAFRPTGSPAGERHHQIVTNYPQKYHHAKRPHSATTTVPGSHAASLTR